MSPQTLLSRFKNYKTMNNSFWGLALLIALLNSCSTPSYLSEVTSDQNQMRVEDQTEDILFLEVTAYGNSLKEAEANVYREAFEAILFKGIPRSPYSSPLIANESESRSKHPEFYDDFFGDVSCKEFVTETTYNTEAKKLKGAWKKEAHFQVNMKRLRKHLESKGIIKKFGL